MKIELSDKVVEAVVKVLVKSMEANQAILREKSVPLEDHWKPGDVLHLIKDLREVEPQLDIANTLKSLAEFHKRF